jgi:uncharacterized protein (DUF2141 family)
MMERGAGGRPDMGSMARMARIGLVAGGMLLAGLSLGAPLKAEPAESQHPPAATLCIHVLNVADGGTVRLGLYDRASYADDKSEPVAAADVKAVAGETEIVLRDIPPGVYAIETYQDINDNDKMDTSLLGLPLEPFGFSRDARPFLSKPSFSRVAFTLTAGEQSQTLHLQKGVSVVASK